MIYVRLNGGLGNQMFQYAAGRRLALHLQTGLKLDLSVYESDGLRTYGLAPFRIEAEVASGAELRTFHSPDMHVRILRKFGMMRQPVLRETGLKFDARLLSLNDDSYLEGYWQSEQYFRDVSEQVRKDFTLREPLIPEAYPLAKALSHADTVSIHIRRGDYVSNPQANQMHGLCEPRYYEQAVKLMTERVSNPVFFVFSDDPIWVKKFFNPGIPFTPVAPDWEPYVDLHLMSLCAHNIIANSSFSWWAAWLNANPEKTVIAPRQWFRNPELNDSALLPDSWIRL